MPSVGVRIAADEQAQIQEVVDMLTAAGILVKYDGRTRANEQGGYRGYARIVLDRRMRSSADTPHARGDR